MNESFKSKIFTNENPKRILSLDGGGIRGILTLGMLKKIESIIRQKANNNNIVLGEYFDLISGTSTGAIIASGLAIGKSVDELILLYLGLGKEIFGKGRVHKLFKRNWTNIRALFKENYSSSNFEKYLQNAFKEISLGDTENIRCGLAINSKRADTYSLWTVANHPDGKYYNANAHLKLWELCRASSAAPYYFKPKVLNTRRRNGEKISAAFIDGGVSLSNNPAWTSFLVAVVPTFGFNWNPGRQNILLTSLGTGNGQTKENPDNLKNLRAIGWASKLSDLFMVDASEMNQIILDLFGENKDSQFGIDSQFENLSQLKLIDEEKKLFTFQRHNVSITKKGLNEELSFNYNDNQIESFKQMDYFENMEELFKIGEKYAEININSVL